MTDKEIVQALEWCVSDNDCIKCPCNKVYKFGCTNSQFTSDTLDLIKRQRTEIKRLKESRDRWRKVAEERSNNNDR